MSFYIPSSIEQWIELQLNDLGISLKKAKILAESIKKMADFYIENPTGKTPWSEKWCQQAQLAYYFPLNYLRNLRVFTELEKQNFFTTPFTWTEFGVGLAPSLEAFLQIKGNRQLLLNTTLLELSTPAKQLCTSRFKTIHDLEIHWINKASSALPPKSIAVMSYSLTELDQLPPWAWSAEKLIIIEPSTRQDGRRLMSLREEAISKNFEVIAPCTHQRECPLLTQSKKDWCHDRLTFTRPEWMLEIESSLPFKNSTLTLSYLALQKKTKNLETPDKNIFRVVGDHLDEKGKVRQLVCRGQGREFFSFLKKECAEIPMLHRGDLIKLSVEPEKKGEELRIKKDQMEIISNIQNKF